MLEEVGLIPHVCALAALQGGQERLFFSCEAAETLRARICGFSEGSEDLDRSFPRQYAIPWRYKTNQSKRDAYKRQRCSYTNPLVPHAIITDSSVPK
eukprot:1376890-Amorphochlora_amoeboformis.AAC.2